MHPLLQVIILEFVISPIYFTIGAYSLRYHAARNKASAERLEYFAETLHPILKNFYVYKSSLNFLTYNSGKDWIQQLQDSSPEKAYSVRMLISLFPGILIVIAVYRVLFVQPNELIFRDISLLGVTSLLLALSWRLGKSLNKS